MLTRDALEAVLDPREPCAPHRFADWFRFRFVPPADIHAGILTVLCGTKPAPLHLSLLPQIHRTGVKKHECKTIVELPPS